MYSAPLLLAASAGLLGAQRVVREGGGEAGQDRPSEGRLGHQVIAALARVAGVGGEAGAQLPAGLPDGGYGHGQEAVDHACLSSYESVCPGFKSMLIGAERSKLLVILHSFSSR